MNHCHRCNSDYSQPGTCNCFAPIRLAPYPAPYQPWYPYPYPYTPWYPWRITWGDTTTIGNDITGTASATFRVTGGGEDCTGNSISASSVDAPWSYTAASNNCQ